MKKILFLLCIGNVFAFGQAINLPIDSITKNITYTNVVNVDSLSKNELFSRAQEWVVKTYNSGKDVVQLSDKDNGKLIGNGALDVSWKNMSGYIKYTISIYVKDGKYKYEITNLHHIMSGTGKLPDGGTCEGMMNTNDKFMFQSRQGEYDTYLTQANDKINLLLKSLKSTMTAKKQKNNDGW